MTAATQDPKARKKGSTFLARRMLPQLDPNSALLPPNKWVLKTAYEFVKGNKSFHQTMGRAALYAGGALAALVAGTVAAVILFPLALPMAAAGAASLGTTLFAGFKAKQQFDKFKKNTLPELIAEVGKKYVIDFQVGGVKAVWQRNLEELRRKKAEQKAQRQPQAAEQKPVTERPKAPETTATQAAAPTQAPNSEKPAVKKTDKKSIGTAFADLAKKMAEERARKLKEKEAQPPKPDAPKPPAP